MSGILTDAERALLRDKVAEYIAENGGRIAPLIPPKHISAIPTYPIPEDYAYVIIEYCEKLIWLEKPSLIIKLLENWKLLPAFADIIKRVEKLEPKRYYCNGRPWDTIFVREDQPFLSRQTTRNTIECFSKSLLRPAQRDLCKRVLVVKGGERLGKTYTHDYLCYINRCLTDLSFEIAWVDLRKQITESFGPLEFTILILDQINSDWRNRQPDLPRQDNQQAARWIQQLCDIIAQELSTSQRIHVLVIDGLDTKSNAFLKVSNDIIELITQLSTIAMGANPEVAEDLLRLVLLGYDQPLKNFKNRLVVEDLLPLDKNDLVNYFSAFARLYEVPMDEAVYIELADHVLRDDDPNHYNRTEIISMKALAIARQVTKN